MDKKIPIDSGVDANFEKQLDRIERQLGTVTAATILKPSEQLSYQAQVNADEIDLRELWNVIWLGKWIIIATTFAFTVASVFYALSLPNVYKSEVLLVPAEQGASGGLAVMAKQFGGLASLAGINLGGGGVSDKATIAIEIIKTWGFLDGFIRDNNIEVAVYAANGWNRSTNTLTYDSDIYDSVNKSWVREFDPSKGEAAEPSSWKLYEKLRDRISISQDEKTGLVNLSVEHYSPYTAKAWVDILVVTINAHIQRHDKDEASKSIEYLKKKIQETNIAGMQSIFYQLVEEQTKTLMLAEVSDEYVFKVLSPAKVAEIKSKPKRALICVLGVLLGGMFSFLIVFVRYFRGQ
ncbi:Wzz/FepE/Etk N-terminal domain-containing protein [Teredinibacter purpureus]|uniref:Wzz/FepE/Etk N-terminal domain-containing protein n=1 Tax=Teredinibacter purpureus TaxID=2731756 RepID=UPI0009E3D0A5|nr:Wzz/FepE/Etk N-terminal domain-containing protein [Teredinibacter purpureus]